MCEEERQAPLRPRNRDIEEVAIPLIGRHPRSNQARVPCHLQIEIEVVLVPAAPKYNKDIFELVAFHPMLSFKWRVAVEILAECNNFLVGHCMKCVDFLDASS